MVGSPRNSDGLRYVSQKPQPSAAIELRLALGNDGGGKGMPDYRVFTVDDKGHILGPSDIVTCDDDEQAIDKARKLKKRFAVEVWQGERLVR
jgi:hypothetical protein